MGKLFFLPFILIFSMWCDVERYKCCPIQMMKRRDGFPVHFYSRPDLWRVALKSHRNTNTELKSSSWCSTRSNKTKIFFFCSFIFNRECFNKTFFFRCTFFLFHKIYIKNLEKIFSRSSTIKNISLHNFFFNFFIVWKIWKEFFFFFSFIFHFFFSFLFLIISIPFVIVC